MLLQPVRDYSFETSQVTPYGAYLYQTIEQDGIIPPQQQQKFKSLQDQLAGHSKFEARYLILKFRRIIPTCLDASQYLQHMIKPKSYGITYFSVYGTPHLKA